jgi:hypothetical protein
MSQQSQSSFSLNTKVLSESLTNFVTAIQSIGFSAFVQPGN